ncbi:protein O-mannose kinase-like [Amphiura filiformis]|uniref:protein O-mannose kinase-like n=1 Tax=Amphiura filiformis TaxID=82378 RepID=UPI003B21083E
MVQPANASKICFMSIVLVFTGSQLLLISLLTKKSSIFPRLAAGVQSSRLLDSGSGDKHQLNDTDTQCSPGHFQLNNDGICHPMLTCKDIQDSVIRIKHIGGGLVKKVYLATWKKYQVSLVHLSHPYFNDYFLSAAKMLQQFQATPFVTRLLGFCPSASIPAMVTEYHRFGSLENINSILKEKDEDNVVTRFKLCLDYVKIINFLHSSPTGTHVMCDSRHLMKTLAQYLVTSDLHIVLNDLDILPVVDSSKGILTNCGPYQVFGSFVAPEQLWPFTGVKFNESQMPGYDEKTDIWKIPAVVEYLLGEAVHGDRVRYILSQFHQKCRSNDPKLRPTAAEVLKEYLDVQQTLNIKRTKWQF